MTAFNVPRNVGDGREYLCRPPRREKNGFHSFDLGWEVIELKSLSRGRIKVNRQSWEGLVGGGGSKNEEEVSARSA